MTKKPRMQFCWFCGAELGVYVALSNREICGAAECEREARDDEATERARPTNSALRSAHFPLRLPVLIMVVMSPTPQPRVLGLRKVLSTTHS